ncbi:hypothetical protein HCH_04208 [Hahella chejuensis KCTC 2396]|uniref:Uncharacterized protein n=1 Tax=Hahella chejuensis (strain KCTC 2396) TaxID=349521 RepID=Q2SEK9_HAHCH|nr:hypothetical protein HCH_04208 [Hahella chejuensis KCTC 2396]
MIGAAPWSLADALLEKNPASFLNKLFTLTPFDDFL